MPYSGHPAGCVFQCNYCNPTLQRWVGQQLFHHGTGHACVLPLCRSLFQPWQSLIRPDVLTWETCFVTALVITGPGTIPLHLLPTNHPGARRAAAPAPGAGAVAAQGVDPGPRGVGKARLQHVPRRHIGRGPGAAPGRRRRHPACHGLASG